MTLDQVKLSYATTGVTLNAAAVSVTNSALTQLTGDGIDVYSPIGVPTIKGNTVTKAAGDAVYLSNASLDMGALTGNSGTGNGTNGVVLSTDTVTVSSALPWTGTLIPVLWGGCSTLTVPPNVTLTLNPGTVIKANSCAYLSVQGTLLANGTAGSPVVFTSWRDDAVGAPAPPASYAGCPVSCSGGG